MYHCAFSTIYKTHFYTFSTQKTNSIIFTHIKNALLAVFSTKSALHLPIINIYILSIIVFGSIYLTSYICSCSENVLLMQKQIIPLRFLTVFYLTKEVQTLPTLCWKGNPTPDTLSITSDTLPLPISYNQKILIFYFLRS